MKKFMRILSVILTLALIAPLITGGATGRAKAAELSAEEIIRQAEKNLRKAGSFEISTAYKTTTQRGDAQTKIGFSMDGTVFTKNPRLKLGIKFSGTDGYSKTDLARNIQIYLDKAGKQYFGYTKCDGKWEKEKLKRSEYLEFFKGFKEVLCSILDLEDIVDWTVSEESVDGRDAWLLTAEAGEEEFEDMMEVMGSGDAAAALDLDEEDLDEDDEEEDLDGRPLAPVIVKYWVDKETMLPIKLFIDMKDYMQSMMDDFMSRYSKDMEKAPEVYHVSEAIASLEYKNINKAEDFSIPKAAQKAKNSETTVNVPSDIDF